MMEDKLILSKISSFEISDSIPNSNQTTRNDDSPIVGADLKNISTTKHNNNLPIMAGQPLLFSENSNLNNNNNNMVELNNETTRMETGEIVCCGGNNEKRKQNLKQKQAPKDDYEDEDGDEDGDGPDMPDAESLKRILTCKRLSEGCNRFSNFNFISRKNSLHLIDEPLPPLTEGETMSYHLSQNFIGSSGSLLSNSNSNSISNSNSSGTGTGTGGVGSTTANAITILNRALKRNISQDEHTSSSSLASIERSPTMRRSSTVSQCSSVMSDGTRNLLNFDLSPDLAPDASLLEANSISPTDLDRPLSPEPPSLSCSLPARNKESFSPVCQRPLSTKP